MNTLYKFAKLIMFASMAIFVAGCKEEDEEEGLPKVIAGFTYSVNVNTGTVTFINTSTDATKYLWNFGNETTSTEINPIKTFVSGTYNVKLKASNASGASNTFEDVLTIQITSKPALPITFDISTVNYTPTVFQGAQFEVVENPSASGSNNKASKVGAITNSGVAFEGLFYDLGAAIDLATNKRIRMNFRSEVPVSALLKLEGTTPSIEKTANHGGTGWESITFDFNSSSKYSKLTLFVDGPGTTAGTFYFDDVVQEAIPVPPLTCTEETVQSISAADFNLTFKTDPSSSIISDNAGFEWVNNPDEEDLNKSCKVGKIARTAASLFANNQINLAAKLDFTANSGFKMKVYSDVTGFKVLLKLEDQTDEKIFAELELPTTKTNEWEELTFPFASSQTNKYDKITIFFDLNTSREKTYYFDDLRLYQPSGTNGCSGTLVAAPALPVDFEDCKTFLASENFGANLTSELIANPFKTGINTSNYVLKVNKPTGSEFFAGIQNTFASNFNLTTTNVFKVKVYSTKANVEFRFELALNPQTMPTTGNPAAVFKTITTANVWTEVSFTFTGLPGGPTAYNQLVIKPDNNMANSPITAGGTYYIDDLSLSAGGGAPTEPTSAAPTPPARAAGDVISLFSGAYTNVTVDTWRTGWSAADFQDVSIAGNPTKKYSALDFVGIETFNPKVDASAMTHVHIDVWSSNFTKFSLKLVNDATGSISQHQIDYLSPIQGQWISYDIPLTSFTSLAARNKLDQYIFVGLPVAANTIFVDNFYFYKEPGGGGACTDTNLAVPINFDCAGINYAAKILGNVSFTVLDNPVQSGINNVNSKVGRITNAGAVWENAFFNLDNAVNFTTNKTIKLKLYSTQALPIKLKFEDGTGGPVEADANHGGAGWQELTFDFTTSNSYNDMVIFVDGPGTAAGTFYVDDIIQVASGGGAPGTELITNGGFETGDDTGWIPLNTYLNGGTIAVTSAEKKSGTYSVKLVAEPAPAASFPVLKQEQFATNTLTPGNTVRLTFDIKAELTQPGATVKGALFSEQTSGAVRHEITFPTLNNTWQSVSMDIVTAGTLDPTRGLSLEFQADCGAAAGCKIVMYIDNVSVTKL